MMKLRACMSNNDNLLMCQLLDIDISVVGQNLCKIYKAVGYAISLEYQIATEAGGAPFQKLMEAHRIEDIRRRTRGWAFGKISLTDLDPTVKESLQRLLERKGES